MIGIIPALLTAAMLVPSNAKVADMMVQKAELLPQAVTESLLSIPIGQDGKIPIKNKPQTVDQEAPIELAEASIPSASVGHGGSGVLMKGRLYAPSPMAFAAMPVKSFSIPTLLTEIAEVPEPTVTIIRCPIVQDPEQGTAEGVEGMIRQYIVDTAKSYLGILEYQYVGGKSDIDAGFSDCSGFAWQIYKKCGLSDCYGSYARCMGIMERATKEGSGFIEIPIEAALPGDLVVFENSESFQATEPDEIYGHMGIYIGDERLVHVTRSSTLTGCVESSIYYHGDKGERVHIIRVDLTPCIEKFGVDIPEDYFLHNIEEALKLGPTINMITEGELGDGEGNPEYVRRGGKHDKEETVDDEAIGPAEPEPTPEAEVEDKESSGKAKKKKSKDKTEAGEPTITEAEPEIQDSKSKDKSKAE